MDATAISQTGLPASAQGRTERQYRIALRHSRNVRILKLALPGTAAILIAGFLFVSWVGTNLPEGVSVASTAIEDGKIVMRNPVMTGQNANAQPYTMRALRAIQNVATPDVIELEDISADLPVSGDLTAKLTATRGIYDRTKQTMQLAEPFEVITSDGMSAQIQSADIDISAGNVVSNSPVSVTTSDASVVAKSMQILDKGKTIVFENEVRMTIDPSALPDPGTDAALDSGQAANSAAE